MSKPRIISGLSRGRKLKVPPEGTRPTSDRAKEGLFSSLSARFGFEDARVLDLFAGCGALGLEAASRGASEVIFVESDAVAAKIIKSNVDVVAPQGVLCRVVQQKVSTYLSTAPRDHFTMVLADPPYDLADSSISELIAALRPVLCAGAVVVIERHSDSADTVWPYDFEQTPQKLKKRCYGITRMDMAVYHSEAACE